MPRVVQQRRLIRTASPSAFQSALVALALDGDPLAARRRALILPTRASIELLRQVVEDDRLDEDRSSIVLPDLLTRDEWIRRLQDSVPGAPPFLTRFEREVLLEKAARDAERRAPPPFQIRPGLIAAMLDFYDELGRRGRSVRRFAGALFRALRGHRDLDRGSDDLIRQTMFLALAFRGYRRAVMAAGAFDEHRLRDRLLADDGPLPFDHIVVAVADRPSDPRGLWPADLDLLGRLRGLTRLDVVVTDEIHDAGFRDRIEREIPGIEEVRWTAPVAAGPTLVRPMSEPGDALVFVSRDREEELRGVARLVRRRAAETDGTLRDRTAVVFQGPLPYLYLAQQVLSDASVPYQTFDALPLGAEPYGALLDVVLAFARTGGTRETVVDLLRAPLLTLEVDDVRVGPRDAAALDLVLTERRSTGEASEYVTEVDAFFHESSSRPGADRPRALRAARAAVAAHDALGAFRTTNRASHQVSCIARFLRDHGRGPRGDEVWRDRYVRARAAVLGALDDLRDAFERHDDRARTPEALVATLHQWIESQTFTPKRGLGGVQLVDAVAARFGRFAHVHLVGLVETDWPPRPRRSVFYTSGLLAELGWPQDADQLKAEQAAFRDLIRLPQQSLWLHGFQLDGDTIVSLSPMAELARSLRSDTATMPVLRVFADETLAVDPVAADAAPDEVRAWLALRQSRPPLGALAYRGFVGPQAPRPYKVSRVDTYIDCPFKYFASNVLRLPEERDQESGLTPLERGSLVHRLFERFYKAWQADGHHAITPANLSEAVDRFAALTAEELAGMAESDRALETTRLLGSIVGRGFAERVFEAESNAGHEVERRLLEHSLHGPVAFPVIGGTRTIEIRGVADRIDVLTDGSLRLVDYKLTRLPDLDQAVQLAVYAFAAKHVLEAADGLPHVVRAAMYFAFASDTRYEAALAGGSEGAVPAAVDAGAMQFARVIGHIEAGDFPAKPRNTGLCEWCGFAGVCRKEYEGDGETAEPL
jgi:RecB family exonuclease